MPNPLEISPDAVKQKLESHADFHLIDVREPAEHALARIEGARLIPMADIPAHLHELDDDREVVVMCHHGVRSLHVANWLSQQGIAAKSLAGGIDLWSLTIDPRIPRY